MYKTILAPIDISAPEVCEPILIRALFHLNHSECKLTLLAVAGSGSDENMLDEVRSNLMSFTEDHVSEHQDRVQLLVKTGLPADKVLETAEAISADCIIMGAHRSTQSLLGRTVLGSTAAKIASQAKCDVNIVKVNHT